MQTTEKYAAHRKKSVTIENVLVDPHVEWMNTDKKCEHQRNYTRLRQRPTWMRPGVAIRRQYYAFLYLP